MNVLKSICRILGGVSLLIVASFALFHVNMAHVFLCMLAAIGYGVGLLLWDEEKSEDVSSFFFSWILFFTVYTGTTFLAIGHFGGNFELSESSLVTKDIAWIYHTFINFWLLLLFWIEKENMRAMISGLWSAMLVSPLMFLLGAFGQSLWEIEIPYIEYYFVGGVLLAFFDIVLKRFDDFYEFLLDKIRALIIWSLWGYAGLTIIPFIMLLFK